MEWQGRERVLASYAAAFINRSNYSSGTRATNKKKSLAEERALVTDSLCTDNVDRKFIAMANVLILKTPRVKCTA